MSKKQYAKLKDRIKGLRDSYSIKDLVAEVYNLFQEYLINENQEEELYRLVDPEDAEDCPAELWYSDQYGCVELYDFAMKLSSYGYAA